MDKTDKTLKRLLKKYSIEEIIGRIDTLHPMINVLDADTEKKFLKNALKAWRESHATYIARREIPFFKTKK